MGQVGLHNMYYNTIRMNLTKRHGGWIAKRRGDQFQSFFESRCRMQGITCIRVPDGCKQIGPRPIDIIRVRTPFDYILGFENKICFVDLKSFDSDRITRSQVVDHQVMSLNDLNRHARAGYVCFFRETKRFVFFSVEKLSLLSRGDSLKVEDGLDLGDLLKHDFRALFCETF